MKYYIQVYRNTKKITQYGSFVNGDYPEGNENFAIIPITESEYSVISACNGNIDYGIGLLKDINSIISKILE